MQYNCFESPCANCAVHCSGLTAVEKHETAEAVAVVIDGKSPADFPTVDSVHDAAGSAFEGEGYVPQDLRHVVAARAVFQILDGDCPPYASFLTSQGE
jgi:hypothetical protein